MKQPADHLRYREEDRHLLSISELSQRARISQSFIHLCLANGCPTTDGLLSQAGLLDWLFEHYTVVRAAAGFSDMASLDGLPDDLQSKMRMANAILTLLEYSESRTSSLSEKRQLAWIRKTIEASLDRA